MLKPEQTPRRPAFLGDLFESLTERGRRLLGWREDAGPEAIPAPDLTELGQRLLSRRGEASGVVIARALLAAFEDADTAARLVFLKA
ncbi:MAG: MCD, Malonyl-CoA decarboxylase MCD, partial [Gemmobacter sp.]